MTCTGDLVELPLRLGVEVNAQNEDGQTALHLAVTYGQEHVECMAHEGLEYRRSYHFFDPAEITQSDLNELAVYTLFEDFEVKRTANDFGKFVTEVCLGQDQIV